jgi:hypothetical protein
MKKKIIKKLSIIVLCFFLINNAYSNYIKSEKIILSTHENIALKSKLNTYYNIVKLFTSNTSINKKELKNKIFKEIAIIHSYPEAIKKYNITIDEDSLNVIYKDAAKKKYISLSQFKNIMEKKYKIKDKTIKGFIISNLTLNNMQKMLIAEDIIVSDTEITNFFNTSNYKNSSKNLYEIKILHVCYPRKRNKTNFKSFKKILNELDKETNIEKLKLSLGQQIKLEIVELNPKNKRYYFLKNHMDMNIKENIIGPFFMNRDMYLFKIIEKQNKTDNYKPYIKIRYNIIQKKKLDENKNTKKFIKLKNEFNSNQIEKKINTSNLTYWAYKEHTDNLLYDKIKNLKINETSNIIETSTGWYVVKVLDRTFDHKSNIYNYIIENIMIEKIKLLTQQFENKIIQNINVNYYN